jgi:hypothetical protein
MTGPISRWPISKPAYLQQRIDARIADRASTSFCAAMRTELPESLSRDLVPMMGECGSVSFSQRIAAPQEQVILGADL